jgi:hypothetical protein
MKRNVLIDSTPARWKSRFVTGGVTPCDGICDGLSFPKYLINNNCDGVTGFLAVFGGIEGRQSKEHGAR